MTREEAIAILQDEAYFLYEDDVPYNRQAFDMAIKALSQEPCDDAISREAVIEWLENATYEDISYAVGTELSFLPSVTQKSGKWIMSDDGLYRPICDKCGAHPWKGYIPTVEEATEVFKYCPNCGAKMETETWNGIHGQITAPKGTFKKIYDDAESEDKE